MAYAYAPPSAVPVEVSGAFTTNDGTQYPPNVLTLWSTEDLKAIHVYEVIEPTIPEGKRIASSELQRKTGPVRVERVAVFEDIPPPSPPEEISDRQFAHQLAIAGVITQAEALDFVKTGTIPAALQAIVDAIADDDARFDAEMFISGATIFKRNHPLTIAIGSAYGWTSEQMDTFWFAASAR